MLRTACWRAGSGCYLKVDQREIRLAERLTGWFTEIFQRSPKRLQRGQRQERPPQKASRAMGGHEPGQLSEETKFCSLTHLVLRCKCPHVDRGQDASWVTEQVSSGARLDPLASDSLSRALSTVIPPILGQKVSESGCDMRPHWGQAISENQWRHCSSHGNGIQTFKLDLYGLAW